MARLVDGHDGSKGGEREVDTRETATSSDTLRGAHICATNGTKLVWNSLRSTLREPSKRSEAVMEDTTCAMRRLRLVKPGCAMLRFFLQMS